MSKNNSTPILKVVWRVSNFLIVVCFIWFSYVQINDTDGWKWIVIYALPIILSTLGLLEKSNLKLTQICLFLLACICLFHISTLFEWINAGKPGFIDYQPTDIKIAEEMRELLGLTITMIAVAALHFQNKWTNKNP